MLPFVHGVAWLRTDIRKKKAGFFKDSEEWRNEMKKQAYTVFLSRIMKQNNIFKRADRCHINYQFKSYLERLKVRAIMSLVLNYFIIQMKEMGIQKH